MSFKDEILKRIDKATDLPTLPGVFVKLGNIINNPNSSATDVAQVMRDDLAMTARVLKVSNSTAFGGSEQITSVAQAIARLGFRQTTDIVRSLSVMTAFKGLGVIDPKKFWRHSLAVAYCTELIPRFVGRTPVQPQDCFTAGLLHDVGIFVMLQYSGDLYASVASMARDMETQLHVAEQKLMGTDHAEIGEVLLTKWKIPDNIAKAVREHHDDCVDGRGPITTSDVVKIADLLCDYEGIDNGMDLSCNRAQLEDQLLRAGIHRKGLETLGEVVKDLTDKSAVMVAAGAG